MNSVMIDKKFETSRANNKLIQRTAKEEQNPVTHVPGG